MKTEVLFVGKTSDKRFVAAIDDYFLRIRHYMPLSVTVIPSLKNTRNLTEEQQKQMEGDDILHMVQPGDTLVLCDERGREMRSVEFAKWLQNMQLYARRLVVVIGGPYGFSQAVYNRANELVSLSKMTFSHHMVRLVLAEQLDRACTIIKGEPYHHE